MFTDTPKTSLSADQRARLRISDLYIVTEGPAGEWAASHREAEVTFHLRRGTEPGTAIVESAGGGCYQVRGGAAWSCSCPDFQARGTERDCKHVAAAKAVAAHCRARRTERRSPRAEFDALYREMQAMEPMTPEHDAALRRLEELDRILDRCAA